MPDYSKLAKGLTSFVKGATKPVRTFRTPDGYTFHELPNGKIVDNLDPAKVDMSWPNAKVFQKETGAFQLGDELGKRKSMIESYGRPDPQNLPKDISKFMPDDAYAQFLRAYNKQNAPKPEPKLKSVKTTGGLNNVKGTQDILPAAEREANKAKFIEESADPRRMYHSTANEFKEFLPSGSSRAVFVTPEAEFANTFALDNFTKGGGNQEFMTGTRSMPVRVQVKNPFDYENPEHIDNLKQLARERFPGNQQVMDEIDAMGMFEHNWPSVENPDIQRLIKQAGHDAFYASERGTKNLGIYDPKSIKSDIGNKGTYDMTKGDINEAKGGAIKMQAGGALKAMQAIAKAAESAGQKAPVTANKSLTGLQDFHTSLGDSMRQRAARDKELMDSFNYKYDKGQRVFTEQSAQENWPPLTVLSRALEGNRMMRENPNDILSKKIIDPETGKAKRTPPEPGYRVRLEHSPDNWSESLIPESAIKGAVSEAKGGAIRMQLGGLSKLAKVFKAPQAEAMRLAQQRAALPPAKGGLGLPANNTPAQREKAMGFNTDVYHGSNKDFDKFKGDQPVFAAENPDIASKYGSAIYPLKLRGEVLEVSDLGKDGASGRFSNNLAKELKIPRKELEDLRMPKPQFDDSSFLEKLEALWIKRFGDPSFSDIGERAMVNKLPKHGIDRLKVTDMSDMGGTQTQHMIPAGSDNIRSRFAAFDPFRKDAATAAAMGVVAPDLLAEEKAKGGGVRMQVGGLSALANAGKAGTLANRLSRSESAGMRARQFADPLNPDDIMRMSEALGYAGAEGKTLNLTQADRSRVFGPNKGGTGFSGLQLTSPDHKKAKSTWGVGKPSHLTRLTNATNDDTIWSTFIGSPTQHMSNPVTVERMYEAHRKGNPSAKLVGDMNQMLNRAVDDKTGKLMFPNGIDISDPSSLNQAQTFNQRKLLAKAMVMGGEKKGEKATQEAFKIIREETDPLLIDSPTYAVGNRLFTIDKNSGLYRPDLNSAFPRITTGDDFGLLFEPAPIELAARDFSALYKGRLDKNGNPMPLGHKDLSSTTPKQFIDEAYLTNLQKEGYKDGGSAEPKPFHDFDQIMNRKDGGTVNTTFEQRLKSAIDQHMAGGEVHMSKGGVLGAIAEGVGAVTKTLPKVDRLSMSYKDVTKRVPEVAEAIEKLNRGEITKQQYNDIVNLYKPVTPYSFVPKPATAEEAIGALRGDAAKSRYGKQDEYESGSKVGLRLDIPAYTQKGVWVNSIHNEKAKKVAYGPTASVKNADLNISQSESKRIALGGAKAPYARIKGEWNPMSEEEAVANAQKYLNDPEWRQIGIDPERHSYFYDRATMQPITNAEEIIQIGPLVLGKNPKYGKIEDFEYAEGGYAYIPPFAKGGMSRQYAEAGSVLPPTPQEIEQMAGAQKAAFGVFPQMASQSWQQQSPFVDKASEMLKAQVTKEWEQAGRPGGAKELSLRIGAVLAGQVPDFVNFGQSMIPSLNKPASVLDPEGEKVARFPMSGTSTDIKTSMREKGIINEDEYPIAEILGAFAAPYAAYKAPSAIKGGLNMVKPVIKEAGDMASRAVVPMRRQFEPSTFTIESTADDLGQNTTYGFRQGVNDVLLDNPNLGTGKNKSREAVGTFMNPNKLINPKGLTEINPMMAIDVRGAGTIGNVPSANKALRKQVGQLGEDLNQTSMAGHRFIPLMTNNIKDASSMLIKTPQGLNKDEIKQLAVLLGDDMVLAHNPRLGGVVVMPFGRVEKGQIPEEFLKAQSAANEVLGKRGKVQFGVSDFDKDRLFMEKTKGDYIQASAQPMSKEQQAQREKLQGLEKFLFPQSRSGIPGQVKAAPVGGLQPWSVGSDYPTSVIGIGNGSRVQYQPRNFSTGKEGSRYDTYMDAERERAQMLDEFHRTLVPKYR